MKVFMKRLIAAMLANAGIATAFAHGDHMGFDDLLIGKAGDPQSVTRTINIEMLDEMRFAPESITAEKNETVRIVVTNKGKMTHEFVLGTARRLKEQNELVKRNSDTKMEAPYRIFVAPGATGEIVWQFSQTGNLGFACLQPGHYEAGMIGGVAVAAAAGKSTQ